MNEIREHIKNRAWKIDPDENKVFYYYKIAKRCCASNKVEDLVSGVLLYNQLVEHLLKDTIIVSIVVMKAKIWPEKVDINLDFEMATFGVLIKYFERFAIKKQNRDVIIKYLKDVLPVRNKVIHRIFDIKDFNKELQEYFGKSDELFLLLIGYYNAIAEHLLYDFEQFEFNNLIN